MVEAKSSERGKHLLFSSNTLEVLPMVKLKHDVFPKQDPIVFIQSAKTGSTNVIYVVKAIGLEQNFTQKSATAPYGPKACHTSFVKGFTGGLQKIKKNPDLYDCSKNNIKFISAHMPLPAENPFKTSVSYISLVRDPLDRALSLTNFMYQRKYLEEHEMQDYILNVEIDNLQTRFLAGEEYMNGECDEATFEKAKENIREKFALVAPTEEVNVVAAIIGGHFEVENIATGRAQVTKTKLLTKDNIELCNQLKQKDSYDARLHEFVKENWNSWKEEHIENISDNRNNNTEYLVITPSFYQTKQVQYMNLLQIEEFSEAEVDLVGVNQNYF